MQCYHISFGAYGFWLPNDPRGSGSDRVKTQHLYEAAGEANKVNTRRSVAAKPHDRSARLAAKQALKWSEVRFTGEQARAIGRGIAEHLPKLELRLHALAVMPDHLHAVAASATVGAKKIREFLKASATRGLNAAGLHPLSDAPRPNGRLRSPWSAGGWTVFLNAHEDILRTIDYVEQNPLRAGFRRQVWSCVTPYTRRPT